MLNPIEIYELTENIYVLNADEDYLSCNCVNITNPEDMEFLVKCFLQSLVEKGVKSCNYNFKTLNLYQIIPKEDRLEILMVINMMLSPDETEKFICEYKKNKGFLHLKNLDLSKSIEKMLTQRTSEPLENEDEYTDEDDDEYYEEVEDELSLSRDFLKESYIYNKEFFLWFDSLKSILSAIEDCSIIRDAVGGIYSLNKKQGYYVQFKINKLTSPEYQKILNKLDINKEDDLYEEFLGFIKFKIRSSIVALASEYNAKETPYLSSEHMCEVLSEENIKGWIKFIES